jgi:hypothetical protein
MCIRRGGRSVRDPVRAVRIYAQVQNYGFQDSTAPTGSGNWRVEENYLRSITFPEKEKTRPLYANRTNLLQCQMDRGNRDAERSRRRRPFRL